MSRQAWLYIWIVLVTAVGIAVAGLFVTTLPLYQWSTFLVLILLATISKSFEVVVGRQSYFPDMSIFFSSILLLPLPFFIGIVLIPHVAEWFQKWFTDSKFLRDWYLQPFNIATHIIAGSAAFALLSIIEGEAKLYLTLENILIIFGAALIYVLVNHILVGLALVLARGLSWQQSRILAAGVILVEVALVLSGYGAVLIWSLAPGLTLSACILVLLSYRPLLTPLLQR